MLFTSAANFWGRSKKVSQTSLSLKPVHTTKDKLFA
jgi:hypothetical protein